ncbi:MAG: formylglycine-generating enzyme family protein, partial [Odoribacter sp.]|nr:formylglycine-generating enzyme family protein [Odoribacter sp.]
PYAYMTATPNQTTAPGLFIYRDNLGTGKADVICKIRWKTSFRREQFDNGAIQLLAQAIEMVFVPAGPYVLGDSLSANCFADSYGRPIKVQTEASNIGLGYIQEGGVYQNVTVSASYPKGFQGFYVMKYELSQEQYVNFLNTLTLAQQKALLPNWNDLKEGDYIFGDAKGRSCRNGIILAYHTDPAAPMIFANNFNKDDEYNGAGDGQTIASNYMSIYDLLAYSSWSGLRPMSEMEFEKACRLPDLSLERRGYAWNKGDGTISRAMNLSGEGFETENVGVGNVNFKKTFEGPLRCGIFAKSANSTAQASGSTYWGGMEMSGNVRELCRNVNDWNFYWNRHGEGAYTPGLWNTVLSSYGVRGGGST